MIGKYQIDAFDQLSLPLYLDPDARERGNTPIIIGINEIFKKYYGTKAVILLIGSRRTETKEEFIVRVCGLKKELRKKYIEGGYKEY